MDTYALALNKIVNTATLLGIETVSLKNCYYRGLAEDVVFDMPMPPFNKSAMDGFACARMDIEKTLTIVDTIYAGKTPPENIKPGECVKIMTGAAVPKGADTVFMKEHSEMIDPNHVKCTNLATKANICYEAEDIKKGDVIVSANTFLDQRHLPLLASAGYDQINVFKQPVITLMATGTELVEPGEPISKYQIRNSNSYQVMGQLSSLGLKGLYNGIIQDDLENITNKINSALKNSDVLILSGGVSVGDYDFVPQLLEKEGFELKVTGTAIQPGKPMVFGSKSGKYIFGLSGNPVSSFIQFKLYVKPFLMALMGCKHSPIRFRLPIDADFSRKKDSRLQFLPANISDENTVVPVPFHGSAHINALSLGNYLMEIPMGIKSLKKGDWVYLRQL